MCRRKSSIWLLFARNIIVNIIVLLLKRIQSEYILVSHPTYKTMCELFLGTLIGPYFYDYSVTEKCILEFLLENFKKEQVAGA